MKSRIRTAAQAIDTMSTTLLRFVLAVFAGFGVALLSGCRGESAITPGPEYPAVASRAGVLDVQVTRDGSNISLINTSARPLGPGRLWINGWYSAEFPSLSIGDARTLDLYSFKDRYGTAFRGGGFFASERADRVVLVEVESQTQEATQLHGLVVVKGDE